MSDEFGQLKLPAAPVSFGASVRRLREDPYELMQRVAGEIGPRPATSLAEAKAAAYLDGRLRRAGMHVSADSFRAVAPDGWDGLLLALPALAGAVLYLWLPLPSLLLALWNAAVAAFLLRRGALPLLGARRVSQNVIGTRASVEAAAWRVVLVAPLDSPPALGPLARALLGGRQRPGRLVACVALLALAGGGMLGVPPGVDRALWAAQLLPAAYLLLVAALELRAARAPYSPGAVSHAGALAALLAAAEDVGEPERVELWAIAVGSSATGAGVGDMLRRYPFDREGTLFVMLEGVGAGSLCFVAEGDSPAGAADPLLLSHAHAAAALPQVEAGPRAFRGGRTLAGSLRALGLRTLAVTCLDARGRVPLAASAEDVPGQVEDALLERAAHLAAGIVRGLDASSG